MARKRTLGLDTVFRSLSRSKELLENNSLVEDSSDVYGSYEQKRSSLYQLFQHPQLQKKIPVRGTTNVTDRSNNYPACGKCAGLKDRGLWNIRPPCMIMPISTRGNFRKRDMTIGA